jgi:pSer/pThr/pTyr-binding forkhead associated (FHA) protein
MSSRILLLATEGSLKGKEFAFGGKARCLVGRAHDCTLLLPADDHTVSRHHCLLDIDPPAVSVRDLGSRNGTSVNGAMIGRRSQNEPLAPDLALEEAGRPLAEGDEVRVGQTVLRVHLEADAGQREGGRRGGSTARPLQACC